MLSEFSFHFRGKVNFLLFLLIFRDFFFALENHEMENHMELHPKFVYQRNCFREVFVHLLNFYFSFIVFFLIFFLDRMSEFTLEIVGNKTSHDKIVERMLAIACNASIISRTAIYFSFFFFHIIFVSLKMGHHKCN